MDSPSEVAPQDSPEPETPSRSLGPLRMIWRQALHYPSRVAIAFLALLATSAATTYIPSRIKEVVDKGFSSQTNLETLNSAFMGMFAVIATLGIATAVRFYYVSWLGERVVADIRRMVQANLLRMPPSFFESNSPAEISSRMTSDTALIEVVVGTTVSVALRNLLMAIGGLIYLFYLAPKLTSQLLVAIPVIIVPIVLFGRRLRNISRSSQDRVADVGAMVTEVLGAMKVVQSFNQEQREAKRFEEAVENTFATARRRIRIRAIMTAVVMVMIFGAITLAMWQGALGVASGKTSGGTIAAFVFAGVLVAGSFGALSEVYGDLVRGAGAASRLNELLNEKPAIAPPAKPLALPVPARGSLVFDHVTFRYPSRLEVAALNDFSLTVEPGETVAIVGPSGAGKSTIFQLAERFYDPQVGTIKLDGVPLTKVDPADVRQRFAFVPQDGVLFAASARDNLRYGNWDASDEQVWEAARAANAEAFLRDLPEGLDTFLGENGARLSGGQRQRVAIARALVTGPQLVLADEPTANLDSKTSDQIIDLMLALNRDKGVTFLFSTHDPRVMEHARRVVYIHDGVMVDGATQAAEQVARMRAVVH